MVLLVGRLFPSALVEDVPLLSSNFLMPKRDLGTFLSGRRPASTVPFLASFPYVCEGLVGGSFLTLHPHADRYQQTPLQ